VATYTYGCRITRTNMTNNNTNEPASLQIAPTLSFTVITNRVESEDQVSAPNTEQTVEQERVICNSPGRKGGTWTGQNGYSTASCLALAADASLGWINVRSNSVPGGFVSGKADHLANLPADNDAVNQLVDIATDDE
jgi:hypothetical protein